MKVVVRFTVREETRALPLLLRHSPGLVLPGRVYILAEEAVNLLRLEGVRFTELKRFSGPLCHFS